MKSFWDERYAGDEFAYGTNPNKFFNDQLKKLNPGTILLPAEGEGRNAVSAALSGWQVTAFDQSDVARHKAEKLAMKYNVQVNYYVSDQEHFDFEENYFDCVAFIFVHMPGNIRNVFHQRMLRFVKPGGFIILEGFEKFQIENATGGPKKIDMLFSKEELFNDFKTLKNITISEEEVVLDEGKFHKGIANVIRLTGTK